MTQVPVTTIIADDHPILREGFRKLLDEQKDICVLDTTGDCETAAILIREHRPDVAVLDIDMPPEGMTGLDVALKVVKNQPELGIVILSHYSRPSFFSDLLIERGKPHRTGYLLKDSPVREVVTAIRTVACGWFYVDERIKPDNGMMYDQLTPRERETWELLAQGLATKQIAQRLHIATRTCEKHLSTLYEKLRISSTDFPNHSPRVVAALRWYGLSMPGEGKG
jgi:DNA-binding NarL/FixJ family response regulator